MKKKQNHGNFFSSANIAGKIIEAKWIFLLFLPFLFFQLYSIGFIHWDKQAYIFDGKWFCGNQVYFEFIRPPLPSFLNCLFGAADYSIFLATALACFAYLAGILILYYKNKASLNQFIFALFAFLFPAILFNSNFGSDLLALAFILLAFAVKGPAKKGVFFALSSLSRYNFLAFGVLFLWQERKKPKNILWFLLPVVLLWLPWMVFNYLYTGNPFFSINESFYLNVAMKGPIQPLYFDQLVVLALFFVSFIFSGLKENIKGILNQGGILAGAMFLLSSVKETRFMNLLTPVLAFNLARLAKSSARWRKGILVFFGLVAIFVLIFFVSQKPSFSSSFDVPSDSFIKDCRVASDKWVFFYDKGIIAECVYDVPSLKDFVDSGVNVVLYDYKAYDLNGFNVINRGDYVILKSDRCLPQPKKYISGSFRDKVYKWLKDTNSTIYDYSDWVN